VLLIITFACVGNSNPNIFDAMSARIRACVVPAVIFFFPPQIAAFTRLFDGEVINDTSDIADTLPLSKTRVASKEIN
jgi:hypothetical protein